MDFYVKEKGQGFITVIGGDDLTPEVARSLATRLMAAADYAEGLAEESETDRAYILVEGPSFMVSYDCYEEHDNGKSDRTISEFYATKEEAVALIERLAAQVGQSKYAWDNRDLKRGRTFEPDYWDITFNCCILGTAEKKACLAAQEKGMAEGYAAAKANAEAKLEAASKSAAQKVLAQEQKDLEIYYRMKAKLEADQGIGEPVKE